MNPPPAAALAHDEPAVDQLSADEYEAVVERTLDRIGLTYRELREQARMRRFDSLEARLAWQIVRHHRG